MGIYLMLIWIIRKKKTQPKYPTEIQEELLLLCRNISGTFLYFIPVILLK